MVVSRLVSLVGARVMGYPKPDPALVTKLGLSLTLILSPSLIISLGPSRSLSLTLTHC